MLAILWIFFIGIVLLTLLGKTISELWQFYRSRDTAHLTHLARVWSLPVLIIGVPIFVLWFLSPVAVSKDSIVGCYEVDARFYPGPNARWQQQLFRFEVTSDERFVLYERLADGTDKPFVGTIRWANESPEKWSIQMQTPHPVAVKYPLLYRQQHGFYYVFRTEKFGNMFFRRVGDGGEVGKACGVSW